MGLSGTGPTSQVLLLEKEGIKYDPDIVIFNIYVGNDIIKIDFGVSGIIPQEIFENINNLQGVDFKVTRIQKFKNFIFRNYFTYSYIKNIFNEARGGETADTIYSELTMYQKQYPKNVQENLEKLRIILDHLKRYSDEKGLDLIVVLIPTKQQVDEGKLAQAIAKYGIKKSDLEVNKAQEVLLQIGKENNITILDLLPDFRKRNRNNTFYFEVDGHWNEKGHELASHLIYDKLINEGLVTS